LTKDSNPKGKRKRSEMTDEERVRDFQRKLYLKAKQDKEFRFYVLYDKVKMLRFLREAYRRVRKNGGKPGVDGLSFSQIEKNGLDGYLQKIHEELVDRSYRPTPVLRVYIPKANGKKRPLGIPTIKDRIVQMSCKMVIEPIFEADFEECSYGFRPKRAAKDAIAKIKQHLESGKTTVFDADITSYFDEIPHRELLILIGKRISDKYVIHLIKMWLKAPVIEDGRMSGGKKTKKGTPQGGVISPLLANIYLHLVDKLVNKFSGLFSKAGVSIVRYADDFVLMGTEIREEIIVGLIRILDKLKLKLNGEKSRRLKAEYEPFTFLGFSFRYDKDIYGRNMRYWNIIPSKKSLKRAKKIIRESLENCKHYPREKIPGELNPILRGWLNYFSIQGISYPQVAKRDLRQYLMSRLWRYYRRKSQRKSKLYRRKAFDLLVSKYGLIDPSKYSLT